VQKKGEPIKITLPLAMKIFLSHIGLADPFTIFFLQIHPFHIGNPARLHGSTTVIALCLQKFRNHPNLTTGRADKYSHHLLIPPSLLYIIFSGSQVKDLAFSFFSY